MYSIMKDSEVIKSAFCGFWEALSFNLS